MPKIVDHEQYRKELLSQCFHLFAEKGYAALTMRQIAKDLGVSTGTLYHYYPSKEALFEQLFAEMNRADIKRLVAQFQNFPTPLERIEGAFQFLAQHEDYFAKQTMIMIEFYQQQGRDSIRCSEIFSQVWKESESLIGEALGVQDVTLLRFIGCFIDGLMLHRMFDTECISFTEQTQMLLTLLKPYLERSKVSSLI